jgi:predicted Zn-dependent protease
VQACLERAHDVDSLNTVVARQLAAIFEQKHDTAQLLHMLHHILQVDINDNDLRIGAAKLYVARNQPDSAVAVLDEGLSRTPNQVELLLARAVALSASHKFAEAAAAMAQAGELDSAKVDSTFIGRIVYDYDQAGDTVHAFEWVRRATVKQPNEPSWWYRYGIGLLARNDTTGAADAMRQFMKLAPTDGRGHLVYANLLIAKGQVDSAVAHAKMAGDADSTYRPNAAAIFLRAGVAALQAQTYPRADTLLSLAKAWAAGNLLPTATFYAGVAQFQRGYGAVQEAQRDAQGLRQDATLKDPGCAAVKAATDFLNLAEPNITSAAAVNRDLANQYLNYIPTLRAALPQMARAMKCPS